ncbi:MAG: class D beta-lactamase [Chitinophagales bacterium]
MKRNYFFYCFSFLLFSSSIIVPTTFYSCTPIGNHRQDFNKYFEEYHVDGCFELFDLKKSQFTDCNADRCSQRFIPASTFKIFNSLVGLQVGAVPDEHYMMKWDGITRSVPSWNHDQDMEEAIHNSTVWYYQEIARRIGAGKMQQYLNLVHYGNMNMSGAIDSFWLTGGLRISCDEQIEFLKDFYLNTYHFSQPSVDIVKKILVQDDTLGYRLSGKTGWGMMKGEETGGKELNIGWFVGYVEKGDEVYFFATNISSPEPAPENFGRVSKQITLKILEELNIVRK